MENSNTSSIMSYYPHFSKLFPHSNYFINNKIPENNFLYHQYMIAYLGYKLMIERNVKEVSFFVDGMRSRKMLINAFQDLKNENDKLLNKSDDELNYDDGIKISFLGTKKNDFRRFNRINGIIIYFREFDKEESFYKTDFFLQIVEPLAHMKHNSSIFILQEEKIIVPPKILYMINTTEYDQKNNCIN